MIQFHKAGYEFGSNSLGYVENPRKQFSHSNFGYVLHNGKEQSVVYNIWEGYYKIYFRGKCRT